MTGRSFRDDEEPEIEERDYWTFEEVYGEGLCPLCGHSDHQRKDCPNCPPTTWLSKPRLRKVDQISATKPLDRST